MRITLSKADLTRHGYPRRFFVGNREEFLVKAAEALPVLRDELPECCRGHVVPDVDERAPRPTP